MVYNTISLSDKDLVKEEPVFLSSSSNPTPIETIYLSNIDQAVTFPVETVFFFEVSPDKTPSTLNISEMVKKAVEEVLLVPYYFMAGRLKLNDETKRLELLCNNAGVMFVSATSRLTLKDLGNLSLPNPTFNHLIYRQGLYKSLDETAIFTIQVTRFECGGFSLAFMTNHAILDGKSASEMFHNLASLCRGEGLISNVVNNDRTCLRARTPPQIDYPHNEYIKLVKTSYLASSFTSQNRTSPSPLIFSENYVHKLFSFTSQMIISLKEKAMVKCSTFEVIVAHLWRARTKAVFENKQSEDSTALFAVDIRSKISPPLPEGFAGNAVITAFATAKARDLIYKPVSFGVKKVKEAREGVTDVYIKSVIDWLEVYKGIPATCNGNFYVSAWWKLPFGELDFGFGKPIHGGPIVSGNDEFVLLLSNGKHCDINGGIDVWMGLEKQKMERFMSYIFEI
ncbi:omega-hydroxypalmitate O-feruloyl transferase-like [Olea europaea subsp. europaea]|uniref:Omega-hydroxypalmitate O-feruloyl transferase-like n=1 Tax=Olea europaea subsp. europaea TaxID=158383 RepID=A0A8S0UZ45_OLEEU|nr:omega-hydroxypalmitate O-feruloyl transferase-like [Olea europaea subsp. europaea]